jgi:hypothetical protein
LGEKASGICARCGWLDFVVATLVGVVLLRLGATPSGFTAGLEILITLGRPHSQTYGFLLYRRDEVPWFWQLKLRTFADLDQLIVVVFALIFL